MPAGACRRFTSLTRMRVIVMALWVTFAAAGCAATEELTSTPTSTMPPSTTTTTAVPEATPQTIVNAWIKAIVAQDAAALSGLVEPGGFVVLAGIENGYSEAEIAALLETGMPPDLVRQYWNTFHRGFTEVAGISLRAIKIGGFVEFTVGAETFAMVSVTREDAATAWITSLQDGDWRFDLVASFGSAFSGQLRRLVSELSDGPAGDRIRATFREVVLPGLRAAFRQNPANTALASELERLTLLLEP